MSVIRGTEAAVNSVITHMKNNLGKYIVDVESRFAVKSGMENIKDWRIDDPVEGRLPDLIPVGWVLAPMLALDQWSATYQHSRTDIAVWYLIQDSDAQQLRRKIYRTAQAVWECLRDGSLSQDVPWSIIGEPTADFSEVITANGLLFSDARVRVTLVTLEEASA